MDLSGPKFCPVAEREPKSFFMSHKNLRPFTETPRDQALPGSQWGLRFSLRSFLKALL